MTIDDLAWWSFWSAAVLIGWTYIGFPLVLAIRALLCRREIRVGEAEPTISLVIAAHNEADVIVAKLHNTLALDYPRRKLEIIVASDGSEDQTNELAASVSDPAVRLLTLPRLGKNWTVNAAVAEATGEILMFTDADSMLAPDALRALVAPFADPDVGGVGGDYRYRGGPSDAAAERTYWSIDRVWKRLQSDAGSMTSATGQIYALRKDLFQTLPRGVTDDFYCSVQAPAAGRRLVYAPMAIAIGPTADSLKSEYARKVRIMTRGLNAIRLMRRLLNPLAYGFYAVQLFSHKVLRRLMGLPLALLFASNLLLIGQEPFYVMTFLPQLALYGAATLGFLLRDTMLGGFKMLTLPLFFVLVNRAGIVAALNVLRGRHYDTWTTERASAEPATKVAP